MPWHPVEPTAADPPPARAAHGVVGLLLVALSVAALARTEAAAPAAPTGPAARALPRTPAPAAAQLRRQGAIDLNRAEPGDLELLPGIGPRLSARIIDDRKAHGPYRRIDDLQRVSGIGPRTLERLRPLVCIAPCPSDRR